MQQAFFLLSNKRRKTTRAQDFLNYSHNSTQATSEYQVLSSFYLRLLFVLFFILQPQKGRARKRFGFAKKNLCFSAQKS
jgi:hypothetical protein